MKKILLFISIIGILMVSGCNSVKQPQTDNKSTQNTQDTVYIDIKNYVFDPVDIVITKGQTITWKNSDGVVHTVTSVTGEFDSGPIRPGETFSYRFDIDGPYDYYCTIHPAKHRGKITVKG